MGAAAPVSRFTEPDENAVRRLKNTVEGAVLTPADSGYDEGRAAWNRSLEHRPALVVMAAGERDVVAAVNFAREHGFPIAVQGTGHGICVACDGVLINTSRMKGVRIDPAARTARVAAGVVWREVIAEAHPLGLAPLSGSSPEVGVAGYTLGGGTGWLARRYGYAADSLLSADVVTAGGELVHASRTSHPELFWALRGGSGNFGVVTALEFALYPVKEVWGGGLFFAFEDAAAVMRRYSEWVEALPDSMTSRVAIMNVPPLPFLPEPIRGRRVAAVQACFLGTPEEGAEMLRPFREIAPPLLDTFATIPYTEIGSIAADPVEPMSMHIGTELLREMPPEMIDGVVAACAGEGPSMAIVEIRHLGGALARLPEDASAVGHRGAGFWMNAIATVFDPAQKPDAQREIAAVQDAVRPWTTGRVLLNGLEGGLDRERAAYAPENYRRLAAVKAQYDPANLFRFNHNIPPA